MAFQPAVKYTFPLKLLVGGIAGVGKTYTAFQLATELSEGERFAVIDAENGKARKYADEFRFDVSELDVFSLAAYTREMRLAEELGYKVLVIDGLSQLWEGKGGIKEMVEMIARRDKITTFSAWQTGNALLADFVKLLLDSPMDIICTVRSHIEYVSSQKDDGKMQYRRCGLAPVQKENMEFDFDLFAEMDHEHRLTFQKSLCKKLSGKVLPMAQEGMAKKLVSTLKTWMTGASKPTPTPVPTPEKQGVPTPEPTPQAEPQDTPVPATPVADNQQRITDVQLASARKLYERLGKAEPENLSSMTHEEGKALIAQLSQEYRQSRKPTEAAAAGSTK